MRRELSAGSRRRTGPLAAYAEGFAEELGQSGYSEHTVYEHSLLLAHLGRWLEDGGHELSELTSELVEDYLRGRRHAGHRTFRSVRGILPLLGHLHGMGVIPLPPSPPPPMGALDVLLQAYRDYLVRERGVTRETLVAYEAVARRFLGAHLADDRRDLHALSAADVTGFVLEQSRRGGNGSAKMMVSGLRSLLRFLHVSGRAGPLASAVPTVAGWRLDSLPRGLEAGRAAQLLDSCDLNSPVGRRDRAMIILLIRLGLRAGEVAALELDDFDWHRGEVVIRGKGDRRERLPLPVDVGEAVVAYVTSGRPKVPSRRLFMRVRAPIAPATKSSVQRAVRQACDRVGIPWCGTHRLRHTAATAMLRAGASLPEVGQVLRHRSIATTAIYAKVDRVGLRTLAPPWPGSAK